MGSSGGINPPGQYPHSGMNPPPPPPNSGKPAGNPNYFTDKKKGEVNELKNVSLI
jgi:hypothetical protein